MDHKQSLIKLLEGVKNAISGVIDAQIETLSNEETVEAPKAKTEPKAKEVKAKTEPKAESKAKTEPKEEKSSGRAFTKDNGPNTDAERKEFRAKWSKLTTEEQDAYLDGQIDIDKKAIGEGASEELGEELAEELGEDLGGQTYTADELREMLKAYARKTSNAEAMKILTSFGVKKIDALDESNYADLAKALA